MRARAPAFPVTDRSRTQTNAAHELTTLSYSEAFKDHLAHPRNAGELPEANAVAEQSNPVCGDRLRLSLLIRNGRIEAARFLAYGCPPTLACGSALAEMLEGMTVADALQLTRKEIVSAVGGLPSRKQHAAALAIETLRAAIADSSRLTSPGPGVSEARP
jgi:nitrogen fixation protein NifU and related proteins